MIFAANNSGGNPHCNNTGGSHHEYQQEFFNAPPPQTIPYLLQPPLHISTDIPNPLFTNSEQGYWDSFLSSIDTPLHPYITPASTSVSNPLTPVTPATSTDDKSEIGKQDEAIPSPVTPGSPKGKPSSSATDVGGGVSKSNTIVKRKPLLTNKERKANHIRSERQRRQNIKANMIALTELIPSVKSNASEAVLLQKALLYIKELEAEKAGYLQTLAERNS